VLNTNKRREREAFLGFWLPKSDAQAFKRIARQKGGISRVLRDLARRFIRRDQRAA